MIWIIRYGSDDMDQMIWIIWYGSYDMDQMIWIKRYGSYDMNRRMCTIWYGSYEVDHMIWIIQYGSDGMDQMIWSMRHGSDDWSTSESILIKFWSESERPLVQTEPNLNQIWTKSEPDSWPGVRLRFGFRFGSERAWWTDFDAFPVGLARPTKPEPDFWPGPRPEPNLNQIWTK